MTASIEDFQKYEQSKILKQKVLAYGLMDNLDGQTDVMKKTKHPDSILPMMGVYWVYVNSLSLQSRKSSSFLFP